MQKTILKNKPKMIKLGMASLAFILALVTSVVASADSYTVQSGDTLSEIALTHNTTIEHIASLNNISNVDLIIVGQVLELDSETEAAATTTTTTNADNVATTTTPTYSSNLNTSETSAKEIIAQRESGGSYTAQNGQYYGRYQLTISYLNGDLSAENQERVADAYVASRYGSWSAALAFWNANGWY